MKDLCDEPAAYVGVLILASRGFKSYKDRPVLGPFCEKHTKASGGWHRQFVSERPAESWERCKVEV